MGKMGSGKRDSRSSENPMDRAHGQKLAELKSIGSPRMRLRLNRYTLIHI